MQAILNFERITRKWASLRRFAGIAVESALDSIRQGNVDVAQYFAKILYFLPFASRSLEKVLLYSFVKASYGYMKKDTKFYEIEASEVPGFDPDEVDKVKSAFESMSDIGIADIVAPNKVRLKPDVINDIIAHIAPYVTKDISLRDIGTEAVSYPYKIVSGVSSLYAMYRGNRLPSSFTVLTGLVSPTSHVKRGGVVETKTTISFEEWNRARDHMSNLRPLRYKFDVEYFKAIGVLYENKIIVKTYPLEVSGTFVDLVIAPAYHRYYTLMRKRRISRVRPWRSQRP